ncbi:hypothetical protein QWY75_13415 [Pontixanthobacter aestiaquae]|uniref:Uncharacterized protein n=1 Tax=Pontixanthobacter aestiaquae TaxID=1509367 RepID=A0A844Z7D1_9SPHN|nr:hypothetical protein [Pontixanthobacter aestiaquae]MDN3647206.1 hypothetical protein [Pontixanthobacter aestiaquae]MXO81819.1 hypothetical protein [Pontixanthobacter aestiaquae]
MCYGLDRETGIKSGQIAHIDKDASNSAPNNLVFLCLVHHDYFDSSTSQSKGLSPDEVKAFRSELYEDVFKSFTQKLRFGELELPASDPYAGKWIRIDSDIDSTEPNFISLPENFEGNNQYFLSGLALRHGANIDCPNLGTIEAVAVLFDDGEMVIHDDFKEDHSTTLILSNDRLQVREENECYAYGMGVTFEGEYARS